MSIVQKIEAIEKEIESQGFVRNYNIYTEHSDGEESEVDVANRNRLMSDQGQNSLIDQSQTTVDEAQNGKQNNGT